MLIAQVRQTAIEPSILPASQTGHHHTSMDFDTYVRIGREAALGDPVRLIAALRSSDCAPDDLAATLRRHHLGELVLSCLSGESDSDPVIGELRNNLERRRMRRAIGWRELLLAYDEARNALEAAGVPVMLLKGASLAQRLYGGLDRRPQYDVDLLVHRRDARAGRRVLRGLGYRRHTSDRHSVTLWRDGVFLDVHHALRSAPAYHIEEQELWAACREQAVGWITVRTLSDEHTLLFLIASVAEDVGFGMSKLKQLCDLWLLFRAVDPQIDWDAWFVRRERENLRAIAVNGAALVLDVLDAADDAPRLAASLSRQRTLIPVGDRQVAIGLVSAVCDSAINMQWFADVYPGSLLLFRAHSFIAGWPGTLRELRPARLRADAQAFRARLRTPWASRPRGTNVRQRRGGTRLG